MSSSEALEALMNYKNDLKKYKNVRDILLIQLIQDDDRTTQIIKLIANVKVTIEDIKVIK